MSSILFLTLLACGKDDGAGDGAGDTSGDELAVDCASLSFDYPLARGELSGAWDAPRRRFVFFGGNLGVPEECSPTTADFLDDTWAYYPDCGGFVKLDASGPSARGRHAVAIDEERGWLILHGGRYRNDDTGGSSYTLYDDVWALDLATDTWTQLSAGGGPEARLSHAATVRDGKFIIYGGNSSTSGLSYTALGDLWSFDLDTLEWTELSAPGGPDDRLFHASALSSDGLFYVYAGGDERAFTGPFLDDLWALDLSDLSWTELHSGGDGAPDGRLSSTMVVDEERGRLVIFGGHDDGTLGNDNQVWAFDLAAGSWSQLLAGDVFANSGSACNFPSDFTDPDFASPERRYTQAGGLSDDGELIIFGGKTDCGVVDDIWAFDLSSDTWTEWSGATTGEVCLRAYAECEGLCY